MRNLKGQFIKGNNDGFQKGNKLWDNPNVKKVQFKKGGIGFKGKHTEKTKELIRIKKKGQRVSPRTEFKKGMTPWNKGIGKEKKEKRIRKSIEMSLWRESVFKRDDYTCQKYGIKGGILNAHHINNFKDFPELRLAINNGITLSEKAHKEFHKKYGLKNTNLKQLLEFLK